MLAKPFRGYILFHIYGRKKQLYLCSIVGYLELLVYMSLHWWEAAAQTALFWCFTIWLASSQQIWRALPCHTFKEEDDLSDPEWIYFLLVIQQVRSGSPRLALVEADSPTVPKCSRHWAEICFWVSLTCWITLREVTFLLSFYPCPEHVGAYSTQGGNEISLHFLSFWDFHNVLRMIDFFYFFFFQWTAQNLVLSTCPVPHLNLHRGTEIIISGNKWWP